MPSTLTIIIIACIIYEVFGNLHSLWYQDIEKKPTFQLSSIEYKLFREPSALSMFVSAFMLMSRINGIIFLIYFGYKVSFIIAPLLWVGTLLLSMLFGRFMKLSSKRGFTTPALLAFALVPIAGFIAWFNLIAY